jgi:hypothetical protein
MSVGVSPKLDAKCRWSVAAKCPRAAAFGGLGFEPAAPDERTQRIWHRGKLFGFFVQSQFEAKYPGQIIAEKEVPWPAGTLHTDIFVVPDRMPIEVKSSTAPRSLLKDALFQLAGEIHFDQDAGDTGALILVNPVDLDEQIVPLVLDSEWRDRVEERANQVVRALATKGDDMPCCTRATPGQCRFSGCAFTKVAWEGWQPPAPNVLPAEAAPRLTDFYRLQQREREIASQLKAVKEERKTAQEEIIALNLDPGAVYACGPFELSRSHVEGGRVEYDRAPYDVYRVKRVGDDPLPVDEDEWGEAPF